MSIFFMLSRELKCVVFSLTDEASIIDDIPTSSEGTDIWKVKQIDETSAHWAWRFPLSNLNKEERVHSRVLYMYSPLPLCDRSSTSHETSRWLTIVGG